MNSENTADQISKPLHLSEPSCCNSPFRAVKLGHVSCLNTFNQSQLSEVDGNGQSILHLAARLGDLECTKFVLENIPVLLDVENSCKETPLLMAVGYGHQSLVELMLDGPLKEALRRALHRDINGTTCLMAAVAQRDNDLALWLLRRFGKPLASQHNSCRMLPLHVAAANGNIEFIRIVTKYDSHMINFKDQLHSMHLRSPGRLSHKSALHGRKLKCDVWTTSAKGQTVLHVAALCGHAHIAKWLVSRAGMDAILHTTQHQANAVHCAAFAGHLSVLCVFLEPWSRKKRRQILTLRDARGNTPLHLAAINNHVDIAQYLLDTGANPKLANTAGQHPDDIAQIRNYSQLAKVLGSHSCKSNKRVKSAKSCTDINQSLTLDAGNLVCGRLSAPQSFPLKQQQAFPIKHYSSDSFALLKTVKRIGSNEPQRKEYLHHQAQSDEGTQTDLDLLIDSVKYIDDAWLGEATAACEEIDKVLFSEI
ncbi:hypothetical protein L596_006033 [Steinernema carpocapsae]|uniref:Uncharacterized protein n=1 Tax=Steinernema carpocapsae TaxID=34508 RepID=A0A4V6I8N8_STECR|nr:hypothetical protein L596_006033 [Steinernema carpocapsae]